MMPASAAQTKTWFRPDGWFTERELSIAVNRVLRDDPSKGDEHNRESMTPRGLLRALSDYHIWPLYAIGLVAYIPQGPIQKYITLIFKDLGFSTVGSLPFHDCQIYTYCHSSSTPIYSPSLQVFCTYVCSYSLPN
jgi:hypothetical protein